MIKIFGVEPLHVYVSFYLKSNYIKLKKYQFYILYIYYILYTIYYILYTI